MRGQQIIMHFTVPPGLEDIENLVRQSLEGLPEELLTYCTDLGVEVLEFPDDATIADQDLDDPFDLIVLYKSGKEISPGIERKVANEDSVLIVYRRPLLDAWCDEGQDINVLIRQAIIEELGRQFDFTDDEIDDMAERHYQGLL